jgi:hypothetical protein
MKRSHFLASSVLVGLTMLNFGMAGVAKADPNALHGVLVPLMDKNFPAMSEKYGMSVTPFNLVFLAFQGFFTSDGIPAGDALIESFKNGKTTPQSLVQAAIKMNRLPASKLNDSDYLNTVRIQLDNLSIAY